MEPRTQPIKECIFLLPTLFGSDFCCSVAPSPTCLPFNPVPRCCCCTIQYVVGCCRSELLGEKELIRERKSDNEIKEGVEC